MKILVTVKRVVDPYFKVAASTDGRRIESGSAKQEINPFDEIALEEAVQMKDRLGETRITAVSIGRREVEEQLRKALAMGADEAILIESEAEWDSLAIAKELAELVKAEKFDLVLMGKQATDDDNNQVGQMLAALLDWPQATFAAKITVDESKIVVVRECDLGEQTLEISLPAVITADLRLNQPRYIALPGIIKARSKPFSARPPFTTPRPTVEVIQFENPMKREPGKKFDSVGALAVAIRAKGLL